MRSARLFGMMPPPVIRSKETGKNTSLCCFSKRGNVPELNTRSPSLTCGESVTWLAESPTFLRKNPYLYPPISLSSRGPHLVISTSGSPAVFICLNGFCPLLLASASSRSSITSSKSIAFRRSSECMDTYVTLIIPSRHSVANRNQGGAGESSDGIQLCKNMGRLLNSASGQARLILRARSLNWRMVSVK